MDFTKHNHTDLRSIFDDAGDEYYGESYTGIYENTEEPDYESIADQAENIEMFEFLQKIQLSEINKKITKNKKTAGNKPI